MDWVQTFPNFEDMPKGWLEEDLSAGLGDKHLFPNGKVFFSTKFFNNPNAYLYF